MGLLKMLGVKSLFEYLVDKEIFYAKKSLGLNGVPIQVYKIRTMHSGSDKLKIDLS
ncbi:sugar transferase, partial [Candidatus Woesearchaeota archaeon]|nr:sugar transferase [Candidatus Woesearchaeota archaeon]